MINSAIRLIEWCIIVATNISALFCNICLRSLHSLVKVLYNLKCQASVCVCTNLRSIVLQWNFKNWDGIYMHIVLGSHKCQHYCVQYIVLLTEMSNL